MKKEVLKMKGPGYKALCCFVAFLSLFVLGFQITDSYCGDNNSCVNCMCYCGNPGCASTTKLAQYDEPAAITKPVTLRKGGDLREAQPATPKTMTRPMPIVANQMRKLSMTRFPRQCCFRRRFSAAEAAALSNSSRPLLPLQPVSQSSVCG
jgi:hypothetical protein